MYHLTEDEWMALDFPDPDDYPGEWEDDGEGGFYIYNFPDEDGNGYPDFFQSIVPTDPDIDLRSSQQHAGG